MGIRKRDDSSPEKSETILIISDHHIYNINLNEIELFTQTIQIDTFGVAGVVSLALGRSTIHFAGVGTPRTFMGHRISSSQSGNV